MNFASCAMRTSRLNVGAAMNDSVNSPKVTILLDRWHGGDDQALEELIPLVYQDLRRLATAQLARTGSSIQCTELVSEAYLRLVDASAIDWQSRTHFFSVAARVMRRVLVDRFRQHNSDKRGNNMTLLTYHDRSIAGASETIELHQLEAALCELEALDPRQGEVVTLRFFGGLTTDEIAQVLSVTPRTIRRDWAVARRWLFAKMQ